MLIVGDIVMVNTPCTSLNLPSEFVTRLDEQVEALNVSLPMSASRATMMRMAYHDVTRKDSVAHKKFEAALAKLHAGDFQPVPCRIVSVRLSTDMREGLSSLAQMHGISVSCIMSLILEVSHHSISVMDGMAFIGGASDAWKYRSLRVPDNATTVP